MRRRRDLPLRQGRSGTSRSEGGTYGNADTAYCGQGDHAELSEDEGLARIPYFFDADKEGLSLEDFLDEHVRLIILGFGREEVTRESVEENVDVADIVPLTRALFRWVQSLTFSKLVNLPNEETGKEV